MNGSKPDDGFTLIEMLIAVMISGIIVTVLTASFLVFFKNASYTSGRDDHAAGAEVLSAWLDRDLASATDHPLPAVATTCGTSTVLLQLSWVQYKEGSDPNSFPSASGTYYQATYNYVKDSVDPTRCMITRSIASGPDKTTLGPPSTLELVHSLGSVSIADSNFTSNTSDTATCASPKKPLTLSLTQYHSVSPSGKVTADAPVSYMYFGCLNARTNGPAAIS